MLACVQDGIQECTVLLSAAVTNSSVLIYGCWSKGRVYLIRQALDVFKTDNTYKSPRYQCYTEREIKSSTFLFTIKSTVAITNII